VDYVHTKYVAMMMSFFELLEKDILWSKPATSADTKTPYGVAYWITKNATEGFNGGNPTGFTAGKAGIDASTYTRWTNWTGTYAAVTKEDLMRKMRKASRNVSFRSPLSHSTPAMGGMRNGIYTVEDVIGLFEELCEDQNMNLGNDLASKDGKTLFKGTPVTWVPALDADSTNPIYMIDWKTMGIGCMSGWENNMTKPYMVPNKHTVRRVDIDVSLNMVCTDVRRNAVLYEA